MSLSTRRRDLIRLLNWKAKKANRSNVQPPNLPNDVIISNPKDKDILPVIVSTNSGKMSPVVLSTCMLVQRESSYQVTQKDTTPGLPTQDNAPAHSVMVRVPDSQVQESLLKTRL